MVMIRIDSVWSGPQIVGGGITQLFFGDGSTSAQDCADAVDDFWVAVQNRIKNPNAVAIQPTAFLIDESDGSITGATVISPASARVGSDSGDAMSPATQGLVRWTTGSIVHGRFLRGHIFLPALTENSNDPDGTPTATFLTQVNAAAAALIADAGSELVVWHRPIAGSGGQFVAVTSSNTADKWAVLRSRRD